jgi:hypothetical protein
MIVDAVQRAILISFFSSYYDFELNVCARKHLSFAIHLHFDLLYIFFKETKGKKRKRAQKQSSEIHIPFPFIHMSFLLSQHLARLSFFLFVIRCDADIIL